MGRPAAAYRRTVTHLGRCAPAEFGQRKTYPQWLPIQREKTAKNGQAPRRLHRFGTNLVANGIAFGNNTFVAVGNGSVILQSDTTGGPTAAPPSLAIGQVPNLTITGEPGRDYPIEYTDDLADTNGFQPLATVPSSKLRKSRQPAGWPFVRTLNKGSA